MKPQHTPAPATSDTQNAPRDAYRDALTHVDERGDVRMVDVSDKAVTKRMAVAEGSILMHPETQAMVLEDRAKKGDVLACARIAGIMAAKRTSDLIPMCHPLPITKAKVEIEPIPAPGDARTGQPGWAAARADGRTGFRVTATTGVTGVTGIEMEALTAASVACLTVYDMCKAVDRGMEIVDVRLLRKEGGRSGLWKRDASAAPSAQAAVGSDGTAPAAKPRAQEEDRNAVACDKANTVSAHVAPEEREVQTTPSQNAPVAATRKSAAAPVRADAQAAARVNASPAPAFAFVGYQNSGKTTLVEKVIAQLSERGYRVGSVKHHGHARFDIDMPGKDSWRHAQAGSRHVAIVSPSRCAEYRDTPREADVYEVLAHYTDVDVVIVEGYKSAGLANVVVAREGVDELRGKNSLDLVNDRTLALACDERLARKAHHAGVNAEVLSINDAAGIARLIERQLGA